MPISSRFVISSSIILLAIGFLTLLGIIGSTAWLGENANTYFEESTRSRGLRLSAVEVRSSLQIAESSQRGYLFDGNEIYLAPYDAAKAQVLTQFESLKKLLPRSPQNVAVLDRLSQIISEKVAEMDKSVALKGELDDEQAKEGFRSNRGKALMDEANLFLSSIIRQADDAQEALQQEQRRNALMLRLVTIIGGLIIVLVVGATTATVFRYAWEVSRARNELNALNLTLEDRVTKRTEQLAEARDRAELLVAEVNHRVANSLSLVASLVRLQSNLITDISSKEALKETETRILAVASVHKRLYSGADARFVDLQEYLSSVLEHVEASMRGQGHVASLKYELEPLMLKTDWTINLGVIVTEWVTNAFKYAYPEKPGEVRVRLRKLTDGKAELSVEDDGIGRAEGPAKGTGLGSRIVNAMARSLGADVEYIASGRGTVARLAFAAGTEGLRPMRCFPILALVAMLPGLTAVQAQHGGPGITKPIILPAYDPNAPLCSKPADLKRVLAFAQDNERKFMQGVARGLELAAGDRGLGYRLAQAGNDAGLMNRQIASLRTEKVGALVAAPVNALALAPVLQQVIWTGAYVGTVVPPPATTILNAPQYLTGKVLADEAAAYIKTRLNGRAKVVLLTHDSLQFLAPRFTAMRDTLRTVPGATIVADISPLTVDEAGGAAMMRTILLANPDVDVVLGADTVVLGALAAMREAGKVRNDQFLGGIDGEPAAVAEIKRGGPYKASVSLASPIFGYAMGQHAADWLDGKSIPQAMDILPRALTLQNLAQYESDVADPAAVYNDPKRRDSYLKMYGNICFDKRDQYLNFPWSSERKN